MLLTVLNRAPSVSSADGRKKQKSPGTHCLAPSSLSYRSLSHLASPICHSSVCSLFGSSSTRVSSRLYSLVHRFFFISFTYSLAPSLARLGSFARSYTFLSSFVLGVSSGRFFRRDSRHCRNQTFVPLGTSASTTDDNERASCARANPGNFEKYRALQRRRLDLSVALSSAVSDIYRVHLPWTMSPPCRAQIAFYSHAHDFVYAYRVIFNENPGFPI